MEAIIALIVGALMNGHTADQIQTVQDDLVYAQTEIMSLEYQMNDLESATLEGFATAAAMDEDMRIELGTQQAGDGGRIAVLEGQIKELQIQNESLRQQLINLRDYVTTD
jgi:cell division protein FtsB|tara:strand:+ start:853 stop:1182 length:330 start_codon:yes stop_codon:yes gene_type:complete